MESIWLKFLTSYAIKKNSGDYDVYLPQHAS